MDSFGELLVAIRACSAERKQEIFEEIRDSIVIHELEKIFNVRAAVILEAICRGSDLTRRGVRGLIAETIFCLDVVPALDDWQDDPPVGNHSYDACLCKAAHRVETQVKLQRKKEGKPKIGPDGLYQVEVQRTRSGSKNGEKTRPYRFGEFDLLAVCMEPSTAKWTDFMYASAADLEADPNDSTIIKTFQSVPAWSTEEQGIWTSNLATALGRLAGATHVTNNETSLPTDPPHARKVEPEE